MGIFFGVLAVVAVRKYVVTSVLDCGKFFDVEMLVELFKAAVLVPELATLTILAEPALPEGTAVLSLENIVCFKLVLGQSVNCLHLLKAMSVIASIAKSTNSGISPVFADIPLVLPIDGDVLHEHGLIHRSPQETRGLHWNEFAICNWCNYTKWIASRFSSTGAVMGFWRVLVTGYSSWHKLLLDSEP